MIWQIGRFQMFSFFLLKDKNPCYLKHAYKGISALISYGLCYSSDVMNKTYFNFFKI
jgi:hypothetical protein